MLLEIYEHWRDFYDNIVYDKAITISSPKLCNYSRIMLFDGGDIGIYHYHNQSQQFGNSSLTDEHILYNRSIVNLARPDAIDTIEYFLGEYHVDSRNCDKLQDVIAKSDASVMNTIQWHLGSVGYKLYRHNQLNKGRWMLNVFYNNIIETKKFRYIVTNIDLVWPNLIVNCNDFLPYDGSGMTRNICKIMIDLTSTTAIKDLEDHLQEHANDCNKRCEPMAPRTRA